MNKKTIIIISTAAAIVLATLILILTLGGKGNNNTSSDVDTNSSEIVSSVDDTSSTETPSNEVGSEESSSQTSTPSKTEITSAPTTSTNKTESKNETSSTTTPATPTTYLEKHNLKLSPLTTNVCFSTEAGHKCGTHKTITVKRENLADSECFYEDVVSKGSINITEYDRVGFETYNGWFDEGYSECYLDDGAPFCVFDKYTGIVLETFEWNEISYNGTTHKLVSVPDGAGGGWFGQSVYCPKDYDGLVFVVIKEDYNRNIFDDGKTHTIDEIIDFENDKYYLFAAN